MFEYEPLVRGLLFLTGLAMVVMYLRSPPSEEEILEIFIEEARYIAGENWVLIKRIDEFLSIGALRESREDFLHSLHKAAEEQKMESIYLEAGIDNPSSTDRLMAIHIAAIKEQNTILKNYYNSHDN